MRSGEVFGAGAAASTTSVHPDVDADGDHDEAGADEEHSVSAGERVEEAEDDRADSGACVEEEEERRRGHGDSAHRHGLDGDGLHARHEGAESEADEHSGQDDPRHRRPQRQQDIADDIGDEDREDHRIVTEGVLQPADEQTGEQRRHGERHKEQGRSGGDTVFGRVAGEEHQCRGVGGAGQQHDRADPQPVSVDEGADLEMPFRPPLIVADLLHRQANEETADEREDGHERRGEEEHEIVELTGQDDPQIRSECRRQGCRSPEVSSALSPSRGGDDALDGRHDRRVPGAEGDSVDDAQRQQQGEIGGEDIGQGGEHGDRHGDDEQLPATDEVEVLASEHASDDGTDDER